MRDVHVMTLTWCLPSLLHKYKTKPDDYLGHLIGHEARGSILYLLKQRGLATGLTAGVSDDGAENSTAAALFQVSVHLSEVGVPATACLVSGLLLCACPAVLTTIAAETLGHRPASPTGSPSARWCSNFWPSCVASHAPRRGCTRRLQRWPASGTTTAMTKTPMTRWCASHPTWCLASSRQLVRPPCMYCRM